MGFWNKRENFSTEPAIERIEQMDEHMEAVEVDHRFVELELNSPYIDVIETMHFFNELRVDHEEVRLLNTKALDFFAQFTKVPLGDTFSCFQTIVLFYYKHYANPTCPFEKTDLHVVFEETANHLHPLGEAIIEQQLLAVTEMLEQRPKGFYFHEKNTEQLAIQFIADAIQLIPSHLKVEQSNVPTFDLYLLSQEMQEIAEDVYGDVKRYIGAQAFNRPYSFDYIYQVVEDIREMILTGHFDVSAFRYIFIGSEKLQLVIEQARIKSLQAALIEALRTYVSLYEGQSVTVRGIMQFMLDENERLYEQQQPSIFNANERFFRLAFEDYCFEEQLQNSGDSPKVAHFLHHIANVYKTEKNKQNGGMLKCSQIIRNAVNKHK